MNKVMTFLVFAGLVIIVGLSIFSYQIQRRNNVLDRLTSAVDHVEMLVEDVTVDVRATRDLICAVVAELDAAQDFCS